MKLLITLATLLFFLLSCTSDQNVFIETKIDDPRLNRLVITNSIDMMYDTIAPLNGEPFELQIDAAGVFQIGEGRGVQYIYLTPGSAITIGKTAEKPDYLVSGDLQAEQLLLAEFSREMSIARTKYSLDEIVDNTQGDFLLKLASRYEKVKTLLKDKREKGVSKDLITLLEKRVQVDFDQTKMSYPPYFQYLNKREPELTEDYYDFVKHFDFKDERLFQFVDIQYAAISVLSKDIDYSDDGEMSKFYREQFRLVDERVENPKIAELLKYIVLQGKIASTGGISGMEGEIQKFIESAQDPIRKAEMNRSVAMWSHLKIGNDAPNFTALTRDGKEVKLSDLKGKNVYIDVWATWCGPCIREIPSLKQMEKKYHDKNIEFVSVSIDKESDREKWKKFIEEKELGGTQIMANEAGSLELSSQYNISGIPRFIMVDANGAIVNVDAPRPSNETAFDKMVGGVLD